VDIYVEDEPVISHIDIPSFGSFRDLARKKSVKDDRNNVKNFKRLNILYGRNYSGKTTLSRIFRALETGRIPPNYAAPSFTVYGEKGNVTQANIDAHTYDIRVYNRDFVNENLSFLVNQVSGEIKTFAIVGDKNKEIDEKIAAIEVQLGSVEKNAGLRFDLERKKREQNLAARNHTSAFESLEGKLRSHASDKIKKNREYGNPVYTIDSIRRDIAATKQPGFKPLSAEEQAAKLALIKQEALPDIAISVCINLKIEKIQQTVEALLSKSIAPTQPIQELLNDSVLQLWVKQGIPLHNDKRDACAFCRQNLPSNIWQVLDAHFNKESSDLESAVDSCLTLIAAEINAIPEFVSLTGASFYAE
jgi:wobble nucleotide-excising tRNase